MALARDLGIAGLGEHLGAIEVLDRLDHCVAVEPFVAEVHVGQLGHIVVVGNGYPLLTSTHRVGGIEDGWATTGQEDDDEEADYRNGNQYHFSNFLADANCFL